MNRQIVKLFAFVMVLFGVLIGFTSWWAVFDAEALKEKNANKRPLLEQQQIPRGRILAADGTVIAKSVPKGKGSAKRYVRRYPEGSLFGHPIGYSFVKYGDSEFEQFHNEELVGEGSEFSSIADELLGRTQEGNDIVTSIDAEAQRLALAELEEAGFGAVVAIEPSTGAVKVMASNAPFDPNRVPYDFEKWNADEIERPLVNRATQGLYPPGSTFKVVTAAAGLDSGAITPETAIDAPGSLEVEGTPLENDFGEDFFGTTLDTALTNSVNTWFGQLGQQLGNDTLFEYMERFGFNSKPAIDLPEDELEESGVWDLENGEVLTAADPVDLARLAIGQERLLATPLQMAQVAAAVANGGKLMKPRIWKRVIDPDGRTVDTMDPSVYSEPISEETAAELTTAMEGVVTEGTGTNAAISGVPVAGKTGTAETPGNLACGGGVEENQAWFIGFAPADDPQIAIAASVECTEQFGNDVAAPIFADVAEAILNGE
ncbi:MAG TPA: penicillin-binding transpeptidase domain-containing protein [Solirubrobacterales bacterium]|nr:penicillin-binding transpeptidase domain-containing protein [Solirubrobacterales bacterium]